VVNATLSINCRTSQKILNECIILKLKCAVVSDYFAASFIHRCDEISRKKFNNAENKGKKMNFSGFITLSFFLSVETVFA
jgi:hypothetical protein